MRRKHYIELMDLNRPRLWLVHGGTTEEGDPNVRFWTRWGATRWACDYVAWCETAGMHYVYRIAKMGSASRRISTGHAA
jgi:hypothetical protein